ncbi:MAG: NUDIX hydrolase [Candidatus Parcubacteria bacterium]|nr:NUDIX hydrolase [Candidatus Parcubacteria bacterium]
MPNQVKKYARPIAICIFRHQGKILATQGFDTVSKEIFYRSIGGGIEFGETGEQALTREVKEELDTEITAIKKIGVFENIFTYQGKPGHEIVFVYDAEFVDQGFYAKEKIIVAEGEIRSEASWLKIEDLADNNLLFYPVGLKELIIKITNN